MIKHISFDLWLTLIKSHPEFKQKRAEFLRRELNLKKYSVREIMETVHVTDKICDRLNEITGKKTPTAFMYRRILIKLGFNPASISDNDLHSLGLKVNKLFMNYEPPFLNNTIKPMLHILKNEGYSMNISSNTGYIEGETMTTTLQNLNIASYFKFNIFSDEIGLSKPSASFFEKVLEQTGVEKWEVLHIGDNFKSDYLGAIKFGFNALHITNQQYTINDIQRHLHTNS